MLAKKEVRISAIAVVAFTAIGIGAVRWDDAHRTKNLDESPWVRAVADEVQDDGRDYGRRPVVTVGLQRES